MGLGCVFLESRDVSSRNGGDEPAAKGMTASVRGNERRQAGCKNSLDEEEDPVSPRHGHTPVGGPPEEPGRSTLVGTLDSVDRGRRSVDHGPPRTDVDHRSLRLEHERVLGSTLGKCVEVVGQGGGLLGGDLGGRGESVAVLDDGRVSDGKDVLDGSALLVEDSEEVVGVEPGEEGMRSAQRHSGRKQTW